MWARTTIGKGEKCHHIKDKLCKVHYRTEKNSNIATVLENGKSWNTPAQETTRIPFHSASFSAQLLGE